ncbi:ATP-grasp domain-containing protein [Chitinophaga sp. 30R24]|uniref:ATP-grasp domain-containing protein n=1 Tax=Chitinophaga sp. 30R24 TaxID=3248838 RepID=UPI003B91B5A5
MGGTAKSDQYRRPGTLGGCLPDDGKVITASKYRTYFKLTKERGCPFAVIDFAENRCREYTPHAVFVMDVCETGDDFYIVECGCMNAAGFYKADIDVIVQVVTAYFLSVVH